MRNKYTVQKS